jgi:hypothetical protein
MHFSAYQENKLLCFDVVMDYKFILHTRRGELVRKLQKNTVSLFMNGISSIYEHVKKHNKVKRNLLKEFQKSLANISIWSCEMIRNEHQRFQSIYSSFDTNVHKIFSLQRQLHHSNHQPQIDCADFLHQCYLNIARSVWKQPFLMYDIDVDKLTVQKNKLKIEKIILDCIKDTFDHFVTLDDDENENENIIDNDCDILQNNVVPIKTPLKNDNDENNILDTTEYEQQSNIDFDTENEQFQKEGVSEYTESECSISDSFDRSQDADEDKDKDADEDKDADADEYEDEYDTHIDIDGDETLKEHKIYIHKNDNDKDEEDDDEDDEYEDEKDNEEAYDIHDMDVFNEILQDENNNTNTKDLNEIDLQVKNINLSNIDNKKPSFTGTMHQSSPDDNIKIVNYDDKASKVKSLLSLKKKVKTSMLHSHINNPSFF